MKITGKMKWILLACAVLIAGTAAGATAYAVGSYGSREDPLISRSYLDEVLTPQLTEEFEARLAEASGEGTADGTFQVVTLGNGDTVKCEVGCELLLRIGGAAACGADEPVLVDTTTGGTLSDGETLEANHLYMVTIADNGFTASGNVTKILVSGRFHVE